MNRKGKMKQFQLEEDSSGGEVGDPIEAKSWEEAARQILEQMGYRLVEVKNNDGEKENND